VIFGKKRVQQAMHTYSPELSIAIDQRQTSITENNIRKCYIEYSYNKIGRQDAI